MSRLDCFALSEPSVRHQVNEDCIAIDTENGVFVIADGMGGRPGGAQASRLAVETFIKKMHEVEITAWLDETHLRKAVEAANSIIRDFSDNDMSMAGLGTTITAVVINGLGGKIVHIGDSRVYLFRESKLMQLTKDHTLVSELMERNLLSAQEAEHHPFRNVLSMVLGTQEKVDPDIDDFAIKTDELLVMATDGLEKAISQEDLKTIIKKHQKSNSEFICRAIMSAVTANELQDDVTVAVVKVVKEHENG